MSGGARNNSNHATPFQAIIPGSMMSMNFTAAASQSAAFDGAGAGQESGGTTILRLIATQDCFVAVGLNPTALAPTPGGAKVPAQVLIKANTLSYVGVEPKWKLSVVEVAADGVLYITEGA